MGSTSAFTTSSLPNLAPPAAGDLQLWLVTGSLDPAWGGAHVYVSDDNATYAHAGVAGRGRFGVLAANCTNSATTIDVDFSASGAAIESTSATGAADDLTAIWINGEVISYETATLTGPNAYTLTGVLRARQSTSPAAHVAGDPIVRLDTNVFKYKIAHNRLGSTVWVKLVSFNRYGLATQDISSVTAYSYAIPASPPILPSPSSVTLTISSTPAP